MSLFKMKRHYPVVYFSALCLTSVVVGCANPKLSRTGTPPSREAPSASSATAPAVVPDTSDETTPNLDLRSITPDEDFLEASDEARLGSAANLLENARAYLEQEQFVTAGYSFALARVMVAMVKADSLSDSTAEFYQDLVQDIERFYDDYVAKVAELPEESSPEAIIAGVEEAEGDTLPGPEDVLPLERGAIDTTALGEASLTGVRLPPVPLVTNRQVANAMKFFQTKGRKVFARWLTRAQTNVPLMTKILREEGLPEELVYVAMIESGFNTSAYSYAHAAGPWQFIKSTGTIFGLEIGWWFDERRDPIKATRAACKYLRKLFFEFDDWYLALAAYNCGELKVEKHIRRANTRNFWQLSRLPRQTRNYVPTYIAAAIMAQEPTAYGFDSVPYRGPDPVDSVLVSESVDLKLAAGLIGSSYQELKTLNPAFIRWCTPPGDTTWLILPDGTADRFVAAYAALPDDQKRRQTVHIVHRGETLSAIARKYGTTVADIRAVKDNRLHNLNLLAVGQELVIPVAPEHYKASAAEYRVAAEPPPKLQDIHHKVRKGENLTQIAARYGTTVSAVKLNNKLYKSSRIYPGQRLVIKTGRAAAAVAEDDPPEAASSPSPKPTEHTVRKGEALSAIAVKYGVTVADLQRLNKIMDPAKLNVGIRLRLPDDATDSAADPPPPTTYTVKKGDTVAKIAKHHGVRESEIIRLNGLNKSAKIVPGDKLKIPPK